MKRNLFIATLASIVLFVTGCTGMPVAQDGHPDVYSRGQSMRTGQVFEGRVLQVREVQLAAGAGAKSLGTAGGMLAGLVLTGGKSVQAKAVGAMLGGFAGSMIGAAAGNTAADEIIVRLENNQTRVIVQDKGRTALQAGQKILVLVNGNEARIVGQN